MTATAELQAAAAPVHTGLPQVNLLPPEIRARWALARIKRGAVVVVGFVLVCALGGYGWSAFQVAAANSSLTTAQAETLRLTALQKKYAEAPFVLGQVGAIQEARSFAMSTEVEWTPYLYAIFSVMPADFVLTSISLAGATPMLAAVPAADPLQASSVSTLTFTARSVTVPITGDWVDGLNSVPGFADAWVSSVAVGNKEELGDFYIVTSTVQVDSTAYANRFPTASKGE